MFVSSPGDVARERDVVDEVVAAINRTDGAAGSFRLETIRWEANVTPQLGPRPQTVVDQQTPGYDVYLGIMSTRFGTPTGHHGSGTEKEFKDALKQWKSAGQPWITFYFDDAPKSLSKPQEIEQFLKVSKFRERLQKQGIVRGYQGVRGSKDGFYEQVSEHLRSIAREVCQSATAPTEQACPTGDPKPLVTPTAYLRDLSAKTKFIDIRGLHTGKAQANRFPIEELFISLTTTQIPGDGEMDSSGKTRKRRMGKADSDEPCAVASHTVPLHASLCQDRLVVVGNPGAGKTTFLRRIAHALCQTELGEAAATACHRLGIPDRTFPVVVRIDELAQHLARNASQPHAPAGDDSPAWLVHSLAAASESNGWNLPAEFFRRQLADGRCTVLLDGLDEAPNRLVRERISRLIENVTRAYRGCRFVVTSRETAYVGAAVLPEFTPARIDPLSDEAVETFLTKWCEALYVESRNTAHQHRDELLAALAAQPDIRRMARNPVMLTAMAVVHWNERRLPEQRADLYESIIRWLSRSREQRPEREKAERTVVLLQELALRMQSHPEGMQLQVPRRWAAEQLAPQWTSEPVDQDAIGRAESFLHAEELDSGIVVARGTEIRFWHRTFQEFLAARAVAARPDAQQNELLWGAPPRFYSPEWQEVILLLAGILHTQGPGKVHNLIKTALTQLGTNATLADEARCAGLLGGIVRDLKPVDYEPPDSQYRQLLGRVMAIFERDQSHRVPIEQRIFAAEALGQAADPRIDFDREDYWITIPAGKFLMGSQKGDANKPNYVKDAYADESPVHEVCLDTYRIARYPVTVRQFQRFVDHEGYDEQRWWTAGGFGKFEEPENWGDQQQYPSRPVVGVSWYEAAAFCAWAGYHLPTEAQWERAARGCEGRKYPWGNEPPDAERLNYSRNVGCATPVGIYPWGNTPDGICDLAGNVWDWCADSQRKYSAESVRNPRGPAEASVRVFRGGGWWSDSRYCRSAYRRAFEPAARYGDLGFRVAAVPLGTVPGNGAER